ncbi:P-loop containing nucleoside triphosphate hydrolase protein [Tribonema minus]|uniref:P-loop containing nucleoside triphosphate hydrolase protein n=1 Tax=Tribonema minus TaxID=303371 RepID=A0A835YYU6_9STRA|nr:P-loop containing nucleoside triphosphate hydrolase protein [Tribonema minus]
MLSQVRLVMVGDCGVGKTAIMRRYLNGYFCGDTAKGTPYSSTLGVDFGCKTVHLEGKRVRLQVWDTSGSARYGSVVSHYLHAADGVALVYDTTCAESFQRVQDYWLPLVKSYAPEAVRFLLVGNKCDLTSLKEVDAVAAQVCTASKCNCRSSTCLAYSLPTSTLLPVRFMVLKFGLSAS